MLPFRSQYPASAGSRNVKGKYKSTSQNRGNNNNSIGNRAR